VSSSLIKEIVKNGGDVGHFVPPQVERRLRERLQQKS
jgi:phosphopantetheine adenylyltransferase